MPSPCCHLHPHRARARIFCARSSTCVLTVCAPAPSLCPCLPPRRACACAVPVAMSLPYPRCPRCALTYVLTLSLARRCPNPNPALSHPRLSQLSVPRPPMALDALQAKK